MTIGYLIVAHQKPRQLLRLVRVIRAQSEGPIIVHLDRKSVGNFRDVVPHLQSMRHVRAISARRVSWGHFSIVQAALDCMSALCSEFPGISHIMHLSGRDYPIKPIAAFEQMMNDRRNRSSMDLRRLPCVGLGERDGFDRLEYIYFFVARKFFRLAKRRLPKDLTFYGGSQFWCLAREHCLYALTEADKWRHLFRHSLIPDEMYFHTILMNSKFSELLINEQITHAHFVGNAAHPSLLGLEDLPSLIRSSAYFARKFDVDADPHIMDALDRQFGIGTAEQATKSGPVLVGPLSVS